ncbi:IgGFc-binding protein-like [Mytilus trossulus]|uniref:IgGFc-binding protein-like n=1 Tax=Mytilus trossulus TaxID=6551 RepID=UPI003003CF34
MTDGIKHAGVELQGNTQTSVFGLSYNNYSGDGYSGGYLAIPTNFLSRKYNIPSFKPYNEIGNSLIALTPIENSTIVNIHIKTESGSLTFENRQYSSNEIITTVINKYDTLEISHSSDLTGTFINSSSPLAVVSGNKCNYIHRQAGCNTFIEMVLPIEQLDQSYIVPYIETRGISTVRLLSLNDSSFTINNSIKNTMVKQNSARKFFDFSHSTISYVHSSNDISVTIYPHELANREGDAFMMTAHGVNQYLPQYDFVVPRGFTSFISITIKTSELHGFKLDGQNVITKHVYTLSTESGTYSSFAMPITSGEHNITHVKKTEFGLWVYGNAPLDAYGYPAGIKFRAV